VRISVELCLLKVSLLDNWTTDCNVHICNFGWSAVHENVLEISYLLWKYWNYRKWYLLFYSLFIFLLVAIGWVLTQICLWWWLTFLPRRIGEKNVFMKFGIWKREGIRQGVTLKSVILDFSPLYVFHKIFKPLAPWSDWFILVRYQ